MKIRIIVRSEWSSSKQNLQTIREPSHTDGMQVGVSLDTCTPMFIALFKITKRWKQHKCLSTERVDKEDVECNGILLSH